MVSFSMKTRAHMPEELVDAAVLAMKNRLLEDLGDEIVSITFFGSRSSGYFTPESDIDMLIIVKRKDRHFVNRIFEIADAVERGLLSYRISFSLHIRSEQEHLKFKKIKSPFTSEVEREGKIVYAREAQS
jgi:predicted nucleotidyltransferase